MTKLLIILTSANKTLDNHDTGFFISELAHPFEQVKHAFDDIIFASPKGGRTYVDPSSIEMFKNDAVSMEFLKDYSDKYMNTVKLSDINSNEFDYVFLPGGHGPSIDIISDSDAIRVISDIYRRENTVVAAICHAAGCLPSVTDKEGKSIYDGREVTAFSTSEEEAVGKLKSIAVLPEDAIRQGGGKYVKAAENWGEKVVVDKNSKGILITGQNPASGTTLGREIVNRLNKA